MNRKVLKLVVAAVFATAVMFLMSGCCCRTIDSRFGNGNESLFETTWQLVQLQGQNVVSKDNFTLEFSEEGRVSGVGSCNRFFGNLKLTGERGGIQLGPMGATMMACPEMTLESRYFQMFDSVDTYTIINNQLYLLSDSKLVALFDNMGS